MLLFLQGYVQYQLGMFEAAAESLKQALAAQPEVESIKLLLDVVNTTAHAKSAPSATDSSKPTKLHDPNSDPPQN